LDSHIETFIDNTLFKANVLNAKDSVSSFKTGGPCLRTVNLESRVTISRTLFEENTSRFHSLSVQARGRLIQLTNITCRNQHPLIDVPLGAHPEGKGGLIYSEAEITILEYSFVENI